MSKRKIAYARKSCIDPEEEGEELPFEPREIVIHKDYWFDRDYELSDELLGRGKFGEVKKCTEIQTGLKLAAKIVNTRKESDKDDVRKEIDIMSQLRHPKILQIYDAFESKRKMCIITELVEGGELFDRIVDPHFDLTERVAILFMRQICDGIGFIHSQGILHLDMKPENIICVAKTGTRIKIIDFGLAMRYNPAGVKVMAGTIDFMAPEVCNYEEVYPTTDMWSVGVICYVLVSGLSPFCGEQDSETICNILRVEYDFAAEEFDEITAGCKDFIKKLLVKDPRKRMTAEDCLKHSWLNKITRSQTKKHLSKKHHIKFFVRRKWKKVIKAVIALNRMKLLLKQRKEGRKMIEVINSTIPEEAEEDLPVPYIAEIPEWKVKMDHRKQINEARRSETIQAPSISSTARRTRVKSCTDVVPVAHTLSGSSGYESSGSTKSSVAVDDKAEDLADDEDYEDDEELSPLDHNKEFMRMESEDTIVGDADEVEEFMSDEQHEEDEDETDREEDGEEDEMPKTPELEPYCDESSLNQPSAFLDPNSAANEDEPITTTHEEFSRCSDSQLNEGETSKEKVDCNDVVEEVVRNDENMESIDYQEHDSSDNSASGSEDDFTDEELVTHHDSDLSRTNTYCPTDTLDDIVSAITSRHNSNDSTSRKQMRSLPTSKKNSSTSIPELSMSPKSDTYVNPDLPPKYQESSNGKWVTRKTSANDAEMLNKPGNWKFKRSSGSIELSKCRSESQPTSRTHSRSEDQMSSSFSGLSLHSQRLSKSSFDASSDSLYSTDDDIPMHRRRHFSPKVSPSPARDMNTPERRRARIAAICGEDYTPPKPSYMEERAIPIEIEYSPPPATTTLSIGIRTSLGRNLSSGSDTSISIHSSNRRDAQPIRGRVSQSPLRSDLISHVRISPSRESNYTSENTNSLDRRRARIAAIVGGNDTNTEGSYTSATSSPIGSKSASRQNSDEARHRRIAAILGGSRHNSDSEPDQSSVPSRGSNMVGSKPNSRQNSTDDARQRRIAAILSNSKNQ